MPALLSAGLKGVAATLLPDPYRNISDRLSFSQMGTMWRQSTWNQASRADTQGMLTQVHLLSVKHSLPVKESFRMPRGAQISNLMTAAVL